MQLSEKEIEIFMYEDLTENCGMELYQRGLKTRYSTMVNHTGFCGQVKWLRQVDLGSYGKLDIVGYYRMHGAINVELFELKAVPIECPDFDQIYRYKKGIEQFFGERFSLRFYLYLIGTGFQSGHYIHNNGNLTVAEYKYDLSGISFDSHSGDWYKRGSEGFDYMRSLRNAEILHGYGANKNGSAKIAQPDLEQSQIEKQ